MFSFIFCCEFVRSGRIWNTEFLNFSNLNARHHTIGTHRWKMTPQRKVSVTHILLTCHASPRTCKFNVTILTFCTATVTDTEITPGLGLNISLGKPNPVTDHHHIFLLNINWSHRSKWCVETETHSNRTWHSMQCAEIVGLDSDLLFIIDVRPKIDDLPDGDVFECACVFVDYLQINLISVSI